MFWLVGNAIMSLDLFLLMHPFSEVAELQLLALIPYISCIKLARFSKISQGKITSSAYKYHSLLLRFLSEEFYKEIGHLHFLFRKWLDLLTLKNLLFSKKSSFFGLRLRLSKSLIFPQDITPLPEAKKFFLKKEFFFLFFC